jgi:ribosomal protein L19E
MNVADIKKNIGQLRIWLNEERIKDADRFVTNEDLEFMLGLREKLPKETLGLEEMAKKITKEE